MSTKLSARGVAELFMMAVVNGGLSRDEKTDRLEGLLDLVWAQAMDAISAKVASDEAEIARLRVALQKIADWPDGGNHSGQANIVRFARDTLKGDQT